MSLFSMCITADESEVSVFSLDEQSADYNDNEISNFVSHASSFSSLSRLSILSISSITSVFSCLHENELILPL